MSLQPENHARKNNMKMKLKEKPRQQSKDPDKFGVERVLDPEPKPLSLGRYISIFIVYTGKTVANYYNHFT